MRIARSFIDDLINRSDLVELIGSYLKLRKAGQNYAACCPFHQEKTPSFSVSPQKQFYYCFGCGAHGNVIGFLMDYAHLSYVEAVQELASRMGMEIVYEQTTMPTESYQSYDELYDIMQQATDYFQQQLRQPQAMQAVNYLKQRGLTGQIAKQFQIGYALEGWNNLEQVFGQSLEIRQNLLKVGLLKKDEEKQSIYDRFRDRVMFPIHDQRGRVIGFGARALNNEMKPKYLNTPETPIFHKSQLLYGWHEVNRQRGLQQIIVVEGYMDVIGLTQHGIDNAVATLGTAITKEHLGLIFRRVAKIIFCFDGDTAGSKAAWRALENTLPILKEGAQVSFAFLPEGEDPDSFVRQQGITAFNEYLQQAIPLSDFLLGTLTKQADLSNIDGKARLVELAKPLLNQLPLGTYQDLMWQKLEQITEAKLQQPMNHLPQTLSVKKPVNSKQAPSPMRVAVGLLIQNPKLVHKVDDIKALHQLPQKGATLLVNLLEFIQHHPHVTTGSLVEYFRDTEDEKTVQKLAIWQHDIPEIGLEDRFIATINVLCKEIKKQKIQQLSMKPSSSLSEIEKATVNRRLL